MENKFICCLLCLFILLSCFEESKTNQKVQHIISINGNNEYKNLLQAALDVDKMAPHFESLSIEDKNNLVVLNNSKLKIDSTLKLKKFEKNLKFIDCENLKNNNKIIYIDFVKVVKRQDSMFIDYYMSYSKTISENVFNNKGNKWVLVQSRTAVY